MTIWAWLKRPSVSGVRVAYLDIDALIKVNDLYGHLIGDAVVQELAVRLKEYQRPDEQLYQMAGDEFMVVYPQGLSMNLLRDRITTLHELWETPFSAQGHSVRLTVSVVVTSLDASNLETFRETMQDYLYRVKQQGANQLLFV